MATIKDIARQCGVSPSTVSRVLNNVTECFSVKDEIRSKILNAARSLAYTPNPAARNLKGEKSQVILLLGVENWIFKVGSLYRRLILSASEKFHENSYQVHIVLLPADSTESELRNTSFDGALLMHKDAFPDLENYLCRRQIPYVNVNKSAARKGSSCVEYNDTLAVDKAMEHLLVLGHKKIAFGMNYKRDIETPEHISLTKRYQAYSQIMRSRKQSFSENDFFESAEEFINEIFIKQKNTAVLVHEIRRAVEIYESAKRMRIRIPEDLSLMCFNESPDSNYPEIDCITVPGSAMGIAAADILLKKMKDHDYEEELILEGRLLTGKTTSAYRERKEMIS